MPPNGVMTSRGKQGRKPRIPAGLSIFPRVLPHQAVPTPWDPALRAFLLPGILGLTQNSMDHEGQTIPSAPKRIKRASNSQKFNQNTKYSRTWLPHLWSRMDCIEPMWKWPDKAGCQREKNEGVIGWEAKRRHHVNLRTDVEPGWPAIRLPGLPLAVQSLAPATCEVGYVLCSEWHPVS